MPPDDHPSSHIDPRYDPAFQRGYQPDPQRPLKRERALKPAPTTGRTQNSEAAQTRAGGHRRVDARPATANHVAPGPAPVAPKVERDAVDQSFGDPFDDPFDDSFDDPFDDSEAPALPPRRTNPYVSALWVIGIVLVVVGVILQIAPQLSTSQGAVSYAPDQGVPAPIVLRSLAYAVSTPMITIGLATIVGLIFLAAVGFHRPAKAATVNAAPARPGRPHPPTDERS